MNDFFKWVGGLSPIGAVLFAIFILIILRGLMNFVLALLGKNKKEDLSNFEDD